MGSLNLKQFFLYLLICSIALSALMGIWAILSGEFGDLQARILFTTLTVVGTSILGLACGAFLESPRAAASNLKIVPAVGIILAVISALIGLWLIWFEPKLGSYSDGIYKLLIISTMFAFSLAQLSLLSMAQLARRFGWSLTAAYAVILLLDSIISFIVIFEPSSSGDFVFRFIGTLSVLAASLTVIIPIFHRLSRTEFVDAEIPSIAKIDEEINSLKSRIAHLEKQREEIVNNENRD